MAREVERKYLVKGDLWRERAGPGVPIRQGYLCIEPDRSVRLRIAGDKAFLTIKGKSQGPARDEFEYPVPLEDAEQMLSRLAVKPLIEKTRHVIQDGKYKWEIDEFGGENQGLVVAEVETVDDNKDIPKPDWLGDEVTDDPRYFNVSLVQRPFSKWAK
jgi:adenylate cyclase